jgi:hypothetical protein
MLILLGGEILKGSIRLKDFLPAIYRQDVEGSGCHLCSLLDVIEEQANLIENGIGKL